MPGGYASESQTPSPAVTAGATALADSSIEPAASGSGTNFISTCINTNWVVASICPYVYQHEEINEKHTLNYSHHSLSISICVGGNTTILAEEETEQEIQLDETNEDKPHPGSSPSSTWMETVDKAISRMEENQLRTDRNIERIDRNIDRLEVETGVAQGVVFDSNEEAMDIEDEDAEVTTPNALKPGRTKND
ncbi:hypothetical protein BDR26DRAFT_957777 [Obelidium mucronatum]|nr:hypothetical protein BDR26DRAFT_957777 [Obelidium mucronatum]